MIPSYRLLAQRIRDELQELERSVARVERAWQVATRAAVDQDLYIDSAALNLHSFYAGTERLFEYIAHQLDGGPPKGESWHRDLLRQMATEVTGIRPSAISADMLARIDEFRRFRHVVRNVYAEHLDPQQMGLLVHRLPGVWRQLKDELLSFAEFLDGVSQADDTTPL